MTLKYNISNASIFRVEEELELDIVDSFETLLYYRGSRLRKP
jgi:hypothetical protein